MTHRIEWSPDAQADLINIRAFIAAENPRAAKAVAAKLMTMADSLAELPHRGRPVADASQARELVVISTYAIRYRVVGDAVLIVRLKHTRQRR